MAGELGDDCSAPRPPDFWQQGRLVNADSEIFEAVHRLNDLLVHGRFEQIEFIDRDLASTPGQIRVAVLQYGRTLVALPDEAIAEMRVYQKQDDGEIPVDMPLWTREEGRSDLEMRLAAFEAPDGSIICKLYDLVVP